MECNTNRTWTFVSLDSVILALILKRYLFFFYAFNSSTNKTELHISSRKTKLY